MLVTNDRAGIRCSCGGRRSCRRARCRRRRGRSARALRTLRADRARTDLPPHEGRSAGRRGHSGHIRDAVEASAHVRPSARQGHHLAVRDRAEQGDRARALSGARPGAARVGRADGRGGESGRPDADRRRRRANRPRDRGATGGPARGDPARVLRGAQPQRDRGAPRAAARDGQKPHQTRARPAAGAPRTPAPEGGTSMSDDALGIPEHRDTVERLEQGVARVAPPDDLYDRILDDVRPTATVVPFRRRLPVWVSSAAAAAVAAAAVVALTLAVTQDDGGLGDPIREASVSNARMDGTLALYRGDEGNRTLVADFDRVADAPKDHFYEIWISRPGSDVKIPIGAFTPSQGHVHLEVPLPTEDKRLSIDISIEDENGPPAHSGDTVAQADLT